MVPLKARGSCCAWRARGLNTLAILDVDSGRMSPLVPMLEARVDNLPKWSPTGDLIAFTSHRDGDYEIYTIRPDGTGLTRLTSSPSHDAHPAWSPDGQWITFSSARGGFKDDMARSGQVSRRPTSS